MTHNGRDDDDTAAGPTPQWADPESILGREAARRTVTCGVKELKDHLADALRSVAQGRHRVVVHRHQSLVAAIVPLADYWFVMEIEAAIMRHWWKLDGDEVTP
jgi:antitoxin (DNA-binding transcriptional repressor) of toxin-antitoxin stability system